MRNTFRDIYLRIKSDLFQGKENNEELLKNGYVKLSTDQYGYFKYLLPIVIVISIASRFIMEETSNDLYLVMAIFFIMIYFFTYRKSQIIYWGNECFLVLNGTKKKLIIIRKQDVVYIEKKDVKIPGAGGYYIIGVKKGNKQIKYNFVPNQKQLDLIDQIDKDIEEQNKHNPLYW